MKYWSILYFTLLIFCSCKSTSKTSDILDVSKYENNIPEINKALKSFKKDTVYELYDNGSNFKEITILKDQIIKKAKYYDKQKLRLISETNLFFNCPVGIYKFYNEKGKLIKQINSDKNYPFSIYDLTDKLRTDYKIDVLTDKAIISITRSESIDGNYKYFVLYYLNHLKYRSIIIDGTTGKVLEDKITYDNH